MTVLVDRFDRKHDYLRISVTDRCNLRCLYCMPEEGVAFSEASSLLSYSEIERIVKVGASLGIKKLRITGGEPLIRPHLYDLIARLAKIEGIEDIALTTNGIFLAQYALKLKEAGLTRVNISLDTLDPVRFKFIARNGDLNRVLNGIKAAAEAGLYPIKLNTVLLNQVNEDEIKDFLNLAIRYPIHVRFIEYMPIGHADENWKKHYLPLTRVLEIANALGYSYKQMNPIKGNGPSEDFYIEGGKGTFGLIHPISNHFCKSCNRLRLTADGNLKPCLYWIDELNVKSVLQKDDEAIQALFLKAMNIKPENHQMAEILYNKELSHIPTERRMSQIGG